MAENDQAMKPLAAWLLLAMLFLAYILSFVDRMILSLLIEPIKADMDLSDTEISLLQGLAFALFYTLVGIPIGRLIDNRRRVGIVAAGVSLWSLMTALCGLAQNYGQLFLARMGVGVGEATLSPAAYSMIADGFPEKRLGLALGIYGLGAATGAGLAFMIGGAVIQLVGSAGTLHLPVLGEIAAWQAAFLILGIPGILMGLLFLLAPEPPRRGAVSDVSAPPWREVGRFARSRAGFLGLLFAAMGLLNLAIFASVSWIAVLLARIHSVELQDAGYLAGMALILGGIGGSVGGGMISDWVSRGRESLRPRLHVCAVAALCASGFGLIFPLAASAELTVMLFGIGFLFSAGPVGVAAAVLQQATPDRMRGFVSAFYLFTINLIGLGLGPTLVALPTDFLFADESMLNYSLAIVLPTALLLSSACFWGAARSRACRLARPALEAGIA